MAGNKFLTQVSGAFTEVAASDASAGAGDAGKLVALNGSGVLADSIVNSKNSSAGAGDAGKIVKLDAAGKIDTTMMPTGIGADVAVITASEALAAGDWINIWNSSGAKARKSDATSAGKHAMGFVKAAVANAAAATVYFEGTNDAVTGQTPGDVFLQTTAGAGGPTPPSGAGNVVQHLGFAVSATAVNANFGRPITLA